MFKTLKSFCVILVVSLGTSTLADEVILTVSGDVGPNDGQNTWAFDRKALEALPSQLIETTTIWTEGMQSFEGVSLDVLLNHVQAEEGTIRAVALNDYAVTIPTSDAKEGGPIVAYSRNSRAMSVRDKGPLWIIYPYDANEAYQSEEIYARSIWQLNRLEVVAQ